MSRWTKNCCDSLPGLGIQQTQKRKPSKVHAVRFSEPKPWRKQRPPPQRPCSASHIVLPDTSFLIAVLTSSFLCGFGWGRPCCINHLPQGNLPSNNALKSGSGFADATKCKIQVIILLFGKYWICQVWSILMCTYFNHLGILIIPLYSWPTILKKIT